MVKLNRQPLAEQILATILALLLVLPLTLSVLRYGLLKGKSARFLDRNAIGRPKLHGVTPPIADVPLSWILIKAGEFQKRQARGFNEKFAGREALIRMTNELWFRLFRSPANLSSNIIVGEDDWLFEDGYLHEYSWIRTPKAALEPWVKDLRRLQDFCRSIGMGFVVILAPGKASVYPETIPRAWARWYDPRPRAGVQLEELFRENGIIFVDAIDLIHQEKRKGPPAPLFPKGGIHWNERAALVTANAVQALFAQQNKPARQLQFAGSTVVHEPTGEENDLVNLMNLILPWRYPCERITVKPNAAPKGEQMNLVMIGDSFSWSLLDMLNRSQQFSEIALFFHYRLRKTLFKGEQREAVRAPATPLDFNREVFAADCLLLDINEASAVSPETYLSAFLRDALANLPDPTAPRPMFRAD